MMDRNAPDKLTDTPKKGYDESKALIKKWHGNGRQLYRNERRSFQNERTPQRKFGKHQGRWRRWQLGAPYDVTQERGARVFAEKDEIVLRHAANVA